MLAGSNAHSTNDTDIISSINFELLIWFWIILPFLPARVPGFWDWSEWEKELVSPTFISSLFLFSDNNIDAASQSQHKLALVKELAD